VIGFDDIELARHVSPGLSTMKVDKVGMGRLAVQLIANRLEFPDSEHVLTVLKPRLIERYSVARWVPA
jgi:DNA-binding LacI/PurR family transcriptional regulator